MFIVYQSNELNTLLLKAYKIIEKHPLSNVFEQEIFIHDNRILFQYLNIFLANQTGIAANFRFYHPYYFIWKLFQKFLSNKKSKNIFNQSIMSWKIMKILDEKEICEYISTQDNKEKKFKFSFLMASMFEQYLLYRPNWINEWEKEKYMSCDIDKNDQWQIKLWKELLNDYKNINPFSYHFANLLYQFQSLIKQKKINKKYFPKRFFIISYNNLNSSFIKILKKISLYSNIYFLQVIPYKQNKFQNPLITLWKKYEFLDKVSFTHAKNVKIIDCFRKKKSSNLLNSIQNDFLKKSMIKKKRLLSLSDNSISINICYNKKNEIEILHEKLLLFFQENSYIRPSDIVVTSFSLNDYISLINSVFSSINNKNNIPFFISTKLSKKTEIIFSSFNKILNLSHSRFENEEILELFDVPEIADQFHISEEEIKVLYYWIEEANIRWALDEKHKKNFCFPKNKQNTWFYGIEKLLLSYAMNDTENIWNNILPCSLINGSRSELIGKLIIFINTLKKWQKKLSKSQYLKSWRSLSTDLIHDFFFKSERISNPIRIIEKKWIEMIDDGLLSDYKKKVSIKILKQRFILQSNSIENRKYLPGVVNFCHPSIVCFIPFKIICFIGADNKSMPKKNNLDNFNLLNKYPIKDDINIYQKYSSLFLQSLTCAEKKFYISYVGYSIKDKNKICPTLLIDQLLSYISSYFYLIGDKNLTLEENKKKITNFLCHIYNQEYFYEKKNIDVFRITHTKNILYKEDIEKNKSQRLKNKNINTINLLDLIYFWKNPIRYFCKNHLNIKSDLKKKEFNTTEPFLVNQLDTFKIKTNLLNKVIKNKNTTKIFQHYLLSGKLPYNFFGKIFWKKTVEEIESISKLVNKYRILTEEKEINIRIKKYKIYGILSEIQNTGLLRWKPSIINYSDRMSLWIEHLIYSIIGGTGESKFIGYKKQIWSYIYLHPRTAYDYLLKYIEGYVQGSKKPLFLIKSGASWMNQIYDTDNDIIKTDNNSKKRGYRKLLETWKGNDYSKGEKEDFYIRNVIKTLNRKNITKICQISQTWLTPLLQNKKK